MQLRSWTLAVIVGLAVLGCGDDAVPGCDPEVSCGPGSGTGSSGDTPGTMSGVASTSVADTGMASADGTVGPATETGGGDTRSDGPGDATDPGDESTDTASSETDGASTTESTGGQGNVEYSAQVLIGALDRILVFKEDLDADRCTWIVLVSPAIGGQYDVTTPKNWSVEQINASDVGDACGSPQPAMFGAEAATSAEGTIELGALGPSGVFPCDVTVDVAAMFAGILPGIPPSDVLDAAAIPITGC